MKIFCMIFGLVFVVLFFIFLCSPSKRREKKEKQNEQKRKIKEKLAYLQEKYVGKEYRCSLRTGWNFIDEYGKVIEELETCSVDLWIHNKSVHPTMIPIKITKIEPYGWFDNYDFEIDVDFVTEKSFDDFEIKYVGDFDTILHSAYLGDISLPKKDYFQYEVGKVVKIQFSTVETENGLRIITCQIKQ
ncbi:MAG: hypothetical protein LBO09_03175 [Candidatus Peribacteria bacterium]|jgi:hypothetical protein|nr:hypothetical protein [Candidatus Peribacteria bacterium]